MYWRRASADATTAADHRGETPPLIGVSGSAELVEICCDVFWCDRWCVPLDHVAGLVDEELLEVPGDVSGLAFAGLRVLEQLIQGSSAVTVHLDL
jgi:hypothetical protein